MPRPASSLAVLCCGLAVAGTVALSGCSSAAETGQVQLAVADLSLRSPGAECSGSDPLDYLHAGAAYRITDDARQTLQRGKLPTGTAEPAYDVDFGNAVRIPTVCSMTLSLPEAPDGAARWLIVEGGDPIALRSTESAGAWTAQVPEAAAAWTPSTTAGTIGGGS